VSVAVGDAGSRVHGLALFDNVGGRQVVGAVRGPYEGLDDGVEERYETAGVQQISTKEKRKREMHNPII